MMKSVLLEMLAKLLVGGSIWKKVVEIVQIVERGQPVSDKKYEAIRIAKEIGIELAGILLNWAIESACIKLGYVKV